MVSSRSVGYGILPEIPRGNNEKILFRIKRAAAVRLFFLPSFRIFCIMIQVAVGIVLRNGAVLLCQRKASARYALKWEFPGGKLEPGETPEECLTRELYEELSIHASIGPLFHRQHSVYPDSGSFDVFYHHVPSWTGTIVNRVFETIDWVPWESLHTFNILEGNKEIVDLLLRAHARA
jgi:8-oxo-dGTP diphosphatase